MCVSCFALVYLEAFVNVVSGALTIAIFMRVLASWVPLRLPWGLSELAFEVSEPILAPIRRALPTGSGIDFSPFLALLLIQAVTSILLRVLPPAV
jgi:YggT family protein